MFSKINNNYNIGIRKKIVVAERSETEYEYSMLEEWFIQ